MVQIKDELLDTVLKNNTLNNIHNMGSTEEELFWKIKIQTDDDRKKFDLLNSVWNDIDEGDLAVLVGKKSAEIKRRKMRLTDDFATGLNSRINKFINWIRDN